MINIPTSILQKIPNTPKGNNFFDHAEKSFRQCEKYYSGEYEFCSDNVAQIINVLERYYKGYLEVTFKERGCPIPKEELEMDHHLYKYAKMITDNGLIPLIDTSCHEKINESRVFYRELQNLYIDSRYKTTCSFEDFKKIFEFVSTQREIIIDAFKQVYPMNQIVEENITHIPDYDYDEYEK